MARQWEARGIRSNRRRSVRRSLRRHLAAATATRGGHCDDGSRQNALSSWRRGFSLRRRKARVNDDIAILFTQSKIDSDLIKCKV